MTNVTNKTRMNNIFVLKIRYLVQGPINPTGPSDCPLSGPHLKSKQSFVWSSPPKVAPRGMKPETLRWAHSKVTSQHH